MSTGIKVLDFPVTREQIYEYISFVGELKEDPNIARQYPCEDMTCRQISRKQHTEPIISPGIHTHLFVYTVNSGDVYAVYRYQDTPYIVYWMNISPETIIENMLGSCKI
jgi:hypothetical protein